MKYPKKLIEVSMPLDDINAAAAREKSIRHGHPSTLHLWWARRPLAAARAVLFGQLVNDPGGERGWGAYPGQTKADAQRERERLFDIIRRLVRWENTSNGEVLEEARAEIRRSWAETCKLTGEDPERTPPFLDPFSGGGTLPLEAQRLGLEARGSDLNPVAVMIGKALIEIPPKFAGRAPVGPLPEGEKKRKLAGTENWRGAAGLAEDVRRYGAWMRAEAERRIGHMYPQVEVVQERDGSYRHATEADKEQGAKVERLTVIAWLWARTVASPNPAYRDVHVPLARSFWLSTKKGKETWVEPVLDSDGRGYRFEVRTEGRPKLEGTVSRNGGVCVLSGVPIPFAHVRSEAKNGRMSEKLMAVVAEGTGRRIYLKPTDEMEELAKSAAPTQVPDTSLPEKALGFRVQEYGMVKHRQLFTGRQLLALTTFSDLVEEARKRVTDDALDSGWGDDGLALHKGGVGATAYADAVAVYLAFAVNRTADRGSTLCSWDSSPKMEALRNTFGRQALPMTWDFAEGNPFSNSSGNWEKNIEWCYRALSASSPEGAGEVVNSNAITALVGERAVISTDPPYYDNIGYADLSDFFYIWLRRSLRRVFPELFSTVLVPKVEELIASPYRHHGASAAEKFFLDGMTAAMKGMVAHGHPAFPVTIYYAFKQSEGDNEGVSSTGWETFLDAVLLAGFSISGTLPIRTELSHRMVGAATNALASSIVLVCRPRSPDAETVSRRQFLRELEETLPDALEAMIGGTEGASPIAPVDLAQAAIGPGMGVFSQYAAVLEADGEPMSVRTALKLINKAIDEYFTHAESDMDADTRFCVDWFQQYGFKPGPFGEADVLARAKGTSVEGVASSGAVESGAGRVRLYKVTEYPADWDPQADARKSVWEACHQLSRALKVSESAAGALLARMPEQVEPVRQLAYRLYTLCERKGWAEDAGNYNELITSWHPIAEESRRAGVVGEQQTMDFA